MRFIQPTDRQAQRHNNFNVVLIYCQTDVQQLGGN